MRRLLLSLTLVATLAVAIVAAPMAVAFTRFHDVPADHTHVAGIDWMARTGVTNGCDDDRFCPRDPVSRAQMATFLHNLTESGALDTPSQVVAQRVVGADGQLEADGAIGPAPLVFSQNPGFRLAWRLETLGTADPATCGVSVTPYGPRGSATVVNVHRVERDGELLDVRYDTFALEGGIVDRRHLVTLTCARR